MQEINPRKLQLFEKSFAHGFSIFASFAPKTAATLKQLILNYIADSNLKAEERGYKRGFAEGKKYEKNKQVVV